jgi:hypothetical protein
VQFRPKHLLWGKHQTQLLLQSSNYPLRGDGWWGICELLLLDAAPYSQSRQEQVLKDLDEIARPRRHPKYRPCDDECLKLRDRFLLGAASAAHFRQQQMLIEPERVPWTPHRPSYLLSRLWVSFSRQDSSVIERGGTSSIL